MNISEPFIRRPVMTTLVSLAFLVLGVLCYFQLPVSNLPDVSYPTINVQVSYPGASPETMANTVAAPLEREFMTIPGMTNVTSSSTLGKSNIVLQFDIDKSMEGAALDVEAALSRAKSNLPPDLPNDPTYRKVNPADTPILYIALTSPTMTLWDLYTYAHSYIGQRLSMIDGVAQVITYGSPYAVRIQADPAAIASLGITLDEIAHAVEQGNPSLPTGQLDGRIISQNIITRGQLEKAEDYEPLVITYRNNAPVRLKDIGEAIDSRQNNRLVAKYIDQTKVSPTVVFAVQKQPGANTVQVSEAIGKYLPQLMHQLPASIELNTIFDRADPIYESIFEVKITLLIAFILVVIVIFLYIGKITDTVIPSLIMPQSIIATFIVMYLMNYTIDNLSLLALTLAIGFIIDDAIVVLENIVRHVEEGASPWDAALEGSKEIGFTIISMTVSLAAVFIPMLFMGGLVGKVFREFSVTLLTVTIASGIVALTVTPMLCSLFVARREESQESQISQISEKLNRGLINLYGPALKWALKYKLFVLSIGVASVLGTLGLFRYMPTDFVPNDDNGFIIIYSQAVQGTSSDRMALYQDQVNEIIRSDPNVELFVSLSSHQQFRDGVSFVHLKPRHEREGVIRVIQTLYKKLGVLPGVHVFIKNIPLIELSAGPRTKGAYQYALQGLDTKELYASAEKLTERMQKDPIFQGISSDLEIDTPQLDVEIKRDQAATLGITAEDIERSLLLAYSGNRVSRIQTVEDQYDVILEVEPKYQNNPTDLENIYLRSNTTNKMVPLGAVASWKEEVGPASINHIGQFPAVTISFSLKPDVPLGDALVKLKELSNETVSPDITGQVRGAAETFEESIQQSGFLLLFAIFAIYIFLGMLYESFIHPITILSTLPPALIGGMLTLLLFGKPLSLYAYLGLILLVGIVKKNGIIMVDYALENIRTKGESPELSIYNACIVRFRPIMMTTISTVMGAVPIAFAIGGAAEARRPLGMVIIGGLIVAQVVTLFLTPVIYLYMERVSGFLRRCWALLRNSPQSQ